MELTILHLFPDFMNLYGEYANLAVLRRHLEAMGVAAAVRELTCEGVPDFSGADLIYMGAGTERRQKIALGKLLPAAVELKAAVEAGALLLFTGNAMETLGVSVADAAGKVWPALALADFTTIETDRRTPGDVVAVPAEKRHRLFPRKWPPSPPASPTSYRYPTPAFSCQAAPALS